MQNYHRHSSYSNLFVADSSTRNEDYAKRAVELGHKIISSVEHGWQGYYFETFELAHKYNLKCVIGVEAYWVKDRQKEYPSGENKKGEITYIKDKTNNHIVILAKTNKGREAINDILSEANITGYYYRPRVDIELLLSLPPEDVFITSACLAFGGYGEKDNETVIKQLHDHFKENFMLEIQYHHTDKQITWNKFIQRMSDKYGIELIVGLDSHYILPEDSVQRDIILEAKGTHYDDEEGWFMDYPDDNTVMQRFLDQGIFDRKTIQKAMDNTDISLTFDDYDDVPIFNKDIKLPTLYPDKTKEEKDAIYSRLISKKFKEAMKNLPPESYKERFEGVKMEVQTYKDTGMVDYPLLDYEIVKDAVEHGGLITFTGRGSACSYWTNSLCGFSTIDRFTSAIKLYPERFISTTRILSTKSLPDIDLNTGTVSILEDSQIRILGEDHVAPMIAFGTLKKKSAFKLYARAKNMDFALANTISEQITKYDEAVKFADEDSKDLIDIYDYVDEQYREYIEQSEEYWGVIADKKKAPSAYLLYQGNIRKEIGLIKCKSESTKKECITCVIDGAIAENYKFLKNDILKVDSVLLINKVFDRINIKPFGVNTLLDYIKDDSEVWNLYANGYTIGVNQVEQDGSRHKCMNYKPHNISELSAFVAAIRPGFKSMYDKFEKRENFTWEINALDNLLKTEELPVPHILFQEQVMTILNYAGFPLDVCYGILKSIAKKHPEKVKPLKSQFLEGFKKRVIEDENVSDSVAQDYADRVWTIVNDNCGYSFNSSHAYSMALDSAYQAWQKAHYPYEFYEVNLQHFSDKGKKDKVTKLKNEMRVAFEIQEGPYKFRKDNRKFSADKDNHCIYPALASIKGMSNTLAEQLYKLRDKKYDSFFDFLSNTKISSDKLETLIKIDYFSEFGDINKLLIMKDIFSKYSTAKLIKKDRCEIPEYIISKYSTATDKQYKITDNIGLMNDYLNTMTFSKTTISQKIKYQQEYLGYIQIVLKKLPPDYYYVLDKNGKWVTMYQLCSGNTVKQKFRTTPTDVEAGNMIRIDGITQDRKWGKDSNGDWYRKDELEDLVTKYKILQEKT